MGSLAQVLRNLPGFENPDLLVSPQEFDDAGVFRINETQAVVQTVDFFPPLVDDPLDFGRIAAANSLSDVYAMGGRPITCLNILGFPDKELSLDIAELILRGGSEKVLEAGAVVAGGHSVRDSEIKYGLAVTGLIDPHQIITNAGARAGDQLILTKPIGSGTLTTAAKKGEVDARALSECVQIMADLNKNACEAMIAVGVHAATDITGFGLLGHAYEMAAASGVCLNIDAGQVPLMQDAAKLAAAGFITRAAASNLEHLDQQLSTNGVDELTLKLLADAQTSGGLLISVPTNHVDQLVASLKERGTWTADLVGEVRPRQDYTVILK